MILWHPLRWSSIMILLNSSKEISTPFPQTADGVILAEDATQVTVGHEDGSRPMTPDERPLLPEMGSVGRNLREAAGPAESLFSPGSVHVALSRANRASFQQKESPANPFREEALLISAQVSRFEIFSRHDPHPSPSLSPDREPYPPSYYKPIFGTASLRTNLIREKTPSAYITCKF